MNTKIFFFYSYNLFEELSEVILNCDKHYLLLDPIICGENKDCIKYKFHKAFSIYYIDYIKKKYNITIELLEEKKLNLVYQINIECEYKCLYTYEILDHLILDKILSNKKIELYYTNIKESFLRPFQNNLREVQNLGLNFESQYNCKLVIIPSDYFIGMKNNKESSVDDSPFSKWDIVEKFNDLKSFRFTSYYIHMRKEFNILMENDKPLGSSWTYDSDNRKHYKHKSTRNKKDFTPFEKINDLFSIEYIMNQLKVNNITLFDYAKELLDNFINYRLIHFEYQDTFRVDDNEEKNKIDSLLSNNKEDSLLSNNNEDSLISKEPAFTDTVHSKIALLMNFGLINPRYCIDKVENNKFVSLEKKEAYIRQVLGWREFSFYCYYHLYFTKIFSEKSGIVKELYNANNGDIIKLSELKICPLIENIMRKVQEIGYCSHIERLMVLLCYFILNKVDMNDVYKFFLDNFIDAYNWVMYYNVFVMSSYTVLTNGHFEIKMTKPYVCSMTYIMKMSNYFPQVEESNYWNNKYNTFIRSLNTKLNRPLYEAKIIPVE